MYPKKHDEMRDELFELFDNSYKVDRLTVERFKKLIDDQPLDYFGKKSTVAHLTGSVVVIDETGQYSLLTHHKKFKKWLQLGGHWADYEESPLEGLRDCAIRELKEEGYGNRDIAYKLMGEGNVLDLDIHDVGGHVHYDVCFLAQVSKATDIVISDESEDLHWKPIAEIIKSPEVYDKRLIAMMQKAQEIYQLESKLQNKQNKQNKQNNQNNQNNQNKPEDISRNSTKSTTHTTYITKEPTEYNSEHSVENKTQYKRPKL